MKIRSQEAFNNVRLICSSPFLPLHLDAATNWGKIKQNEKPVFDHIFVKGETGTFLYIKT